jgi:hypothetical protein
MQELECGEEAATEGSELAIIDIGVVINPRHPAVINTQYLARFLSYSGGILSLFSCSTNSNMRQNNVQNMYNV